ncbi:hypothetical protein SPRG_01121 [Saprolegnia parasitica CBS 223.65]|uniref:Uncharacterized protein n=1 Tax=Saprolegnia parasitica (strain CBS 223.65) TaxID=695850 RepID=A0A067D7S1_SAPPC|nr:hypothetical protein SPRG_01121 [Saprolegnia parasitica CBS 223.65]KDO35057.1 hypothetical protein SPRG_01121 [Saprolegnia parasitica CBS 223.65]|eukprot:XP_012194710.1 hypothetical protein SPRG_01121 [Saprolegnia parasitica CBS 223.65]
MQVKFLLGVLAGVSAASYKPQQGYKQQPQAYGNPGYGNPGYGNPSYDNDGYGNHGYGYDKPQPTYAAPSYAPYKSHYKVDTTAPYPYTYFSADHKKDQLSIPKLGDYHCFLTGAPWTTCGRKSLTNYFLDQCLVFYVQMSANVNGICGGKPPKPTPDARAQGAQRRLLQPRLPVRTDAQAHDAQAQDRRLRCSHERPDVDASSPAYLQEKCYQKSFVSITTATVMCLTENYIRVNFIEHYAARACGNPIEGPILYLKKLHAFIKNVRDCTGNDAVTKFPNLYKSFKTTDGLAYNPNAPFYDTDSGVKTYQYTSGEASGLGAYTVGNKFLCANTDELVESSNAKYSHVYLHVPSTNHYSLTDKRVPGAESQPLDISASMYATCTQSKANTKLEDQVYRYCQNADYTSDQSLRSLYDSVHYVEKVTTALRRPLTIAEIAVRSAGVHEQPILEGFGIMYYCGFYACVANHDGDANQCYPAFKEDNDWNVPNPSTKTKSAEINDCIDDGYLSTDDIAQNLDVTAYVDALARRNYICLAENVIVDFLTLIYPDWNLENDALTLVYGRHLADERCYAELSFKDENNDVSPAPCTSNVELYNMLETALASLSATCKENKVATREPWSEPEPHYNGHYNKGQVYPKAPVYKA